MQRRIQIATVVVLWASMAVAGCGGPPPGYSRAHGKLVYKGEPAAGAFLMLHPETSKPGAEAVTASATVGDDGTFELVSRAGDGAPAGRYKVLVAWPTEEGQAPSPETSRPKATKTSRKKGATATTRRNNKPGAMERDRFQGRYASDESPLTIVEVKAEPTDLGTLQIPE